MLKSLITNTTIFGIAVYSLYKASTLFFPPEKSQNFQKVDKMPTILKFLVSLLYEFALICILYISKQVFLGWFMHKLPLLRYEMSHSLEQIEEKRRSHIERQLEKGLLSSEEVAFYKRQRKTSAYTAATRESRSSSRVTRAEVDALKAFAFTGFDFSDDEF